MALSAAFTNRAVLWRELKRSAYRPWLFVPRYAAVLIILIVYGLSTPAKMPNLIYGRHGELIQDPHYLRRVQAEAEGERTFKTLSTFLEWQMLVIVLMTPAVTAGALGHEKERDTLIALFGTELRSYDIVIDKFLARLLIVLQPLVFVAPLLMFFAGTGNLPLMRLGLALGQVVLVMFALSAACMLSSVWTRRTSDALLGCYSAMIIVVLIDIVFAAYVPWPDWLNPFAMLSQILSSGPRAKINLVIAHLVTYTLIGIVCLSLAVARLRPAALRQGEQRPGKWMWAFRRPITNDPIRWRERQVYGLAPLPILRALPTSLALSGTFVFSLILAGTAFDRYLAFNFFPHLMAGNFNQAMDVLGRVSVNRVLEEVSIMGVILCVLSGVIVSARSANSVAEEKRRKTWDDLAITPKSEEEIIRSKQWGVFDAAIPHAIAYAIPLFAMAALAGWTGIQLATCWFAGALFVIIMAMLIFTPAPKPEIRQHRRGPDPEWSGIPARDRDLRPLDVQKGETKMRPGWEYWLREAE